MKARILAADGFEELTLFLPWYRLREEGVDVRIASPRMHVLVGEHGYRVEPAVATLLVEKPRAIDASCSFKNEQTAVESLALCVFGLQLGQHAFCQLHHVQCPPLKNLHTDETIGD